MRPRISARRVAVLGTITLFLATAAYMPCGSLTAATISGTLKTAAGKPIRAALTIHDLSTPRTTTQTPFDHQFATKSDGTFSLTNIPAGKYEFCVEAPQKNALDPCIRTPGGAPTLTVAGSGCSGPVILGVQITPAGSALPLPASGLLVETSGTVSAQLSVNSADVSLTPLGDTVSAVTANDSLDATASSGPVTLTLTADTATATASLQVASSLPFISSISQAEWPAGKQTSPGYRESPPGNPPAARFTSQWSPPQQR